MAGLDREAQDALIAALGATSPDPRNFTDREWALLRYADRLTGTPSAVSNEDIEALRTAGLDDRAIHDACAIISYFAFVNRIADGLGVELEEIPEQH